MFLISFISREYSEVFQETKKALQYLQENELIEWNDSHQKYVSTKLGKATMASGLAPEEGIIVFEELRKARKNFVLDNELHLVFQVTPIFHGIEPNWSKFLRIYSQLNSETKRVCCLLGLHEESLTKWSVRAPSYHTQDSIVILHKRIYAALILSDLIQEIPFYILYEKSLHFFIHLYSI